ncbi:hypothetical protein GGX14DRAFT_153805 [Mycena pura]|uniref:Uncharacterized protein n=1 Tax=Mycena pura TaxID=153505 RepID=A0AAD6V515_9AGAR|nr:hypothetical protein GGX14DRAFT_153805 [Mycena pura]
MYATMLGMETAIVLLTLWKGLHVFFLSRLHQHSQLVTTFYRDGIAYYLVMLFVLIIVTTLQSVALVKSHLNVRTHTFLNEFIPDTTAISRGDSFASHTRNFDLPSCRPRPRGRKSEQ